MPWYQLDGLEIRPELVQTVAGIVGAGLGGREPMTGAGRGGMRPASLGDSGVASTVMGGMLAASGLMGCRIVLLTVDSQCPGFLAVAAVGLKLAGQVGQCSCFCMFSSFLGRQGCGLRST